MYFPGDDSSIRSTYPDTCRDRKEPDSSPTEPTSDRHTTEVSKRLTSRRTSDDDINITKTTKSSLLSRRDTDTKITKTTNVIDVQETKTSAKSTVVSRDSDDKKSTFTRKNTGDKKTLLSRRDSNDKKSTLTRKDTNDTIKTPSKRIVEDQPKSTKPQTKPVEKPSVSTPTSRPFSNRTNDKAIPKTINKYGTATSSDIYSAPLRHQQKGAPLKASVVQTDVEKIVSPYGVGVTDENGLPLFGLRALKRRNQQSTAGKLFLRATSRI